MKNNNSPFTQVFIILTLVFASFVNVTPVYAAGTVGSGTPASCTEAAFNTALVGGGAVSFNCGAAPLTLTITTTKTIASNTQIDGGGLITISGGNTVQLFIVNSAITFNITNLTLSDGFISNGNGGAININSGATVNISNSTLNHNNTKGTTLDGIGYGGAIYVNSAALNITNSTFSNNGADVEVIGDLALGGGAIQNNDGTVTISGSTFNGNFVDSHTADGGAIYNGDFDGGPGIPDGNPDVLTITNSTFYNNQLLNDTAGSSGGAIRSASTLTVTHSTFSNNDSGITELGGEAGAMTITHGTAILTNNIFANSTAADCAVRSTGTIDGSSAGNLIETDLGCGASISSSDPVLGALQNNGGPTQTMVLGGGSPAINAIATCIVSTDQRGVIRPQPTAGNCDIGAYELDTTAPTVTNVTSTTANGTYTTPSVIAVTVTFSENVTVTGTPQLTLETGTIDRTANYASGSGTAILTFNYAVQAGDASSDLDYVATTSLTLNGGTIKDAATNNATLILPAPAATGSLGANKAIVIDAIAPTVSMSSVASNPTNTSPIAVTVTFSESVSGFTSGDITTGNGTISNFAGTGASYTFDLTPSANGLVTANIAASMAQDAAGNNNTAATQFSRTYDTTAPTVSISSVASNPTNTSPIAVTVTFSESVSGFTSGDITTGNGTISNFAGTGASYTFDLTPSANGLVTANIAASMAQDAAGNNNTAATQFSRTYDTTAPTVSMSSVASNPTNTSPIAVTVTFSESVSGFTSGDITTGNGTISNFAGTGASYTFDLIPSANGLVTANIAASVAQDAAGNNNTAATQFSRTYDTTAPTVSMSSVASNPTNTSPIAVTVTFSESVSGFTSGDITTGNGTISNFAGTGASYTFDLTPSANGLVTANIAASMAQDAAGNNNTAATQFSRTYDTTAPTVSMSSVASNPTNTSPIAVTVTFSESVSGFTSGDITTGNGTISNFAGTGASYTFDLTPSANGLVTANIAASMAQDAAGNNNTAATQFSRTYDTTAPTVSISSVASNPTNTSPIAVTVTFSESVSGFTSGDITTGNGTISNFAGTGASYTFDLTPSANGLVTANIAASMAQDAAGNNNTAATQFSRTYDTTAPTVSMSSVASNPTNTSPIAVTVTFSESVSGFTSGDITAGNGTISNFAGTGASYTFDLIPSANGLVTANIAASVAQDAAGNNNTAATQFSRTYDTTAPTVTNVTSTTANGTYTTPSVIAVTVTFSENVTVTGTPQLTLETGTIDRTVNYTSGSGTAILTFNYAVQAGDTSSDLDYVATTSLTLNGGTIKNAATNNATLTLPTPGTTGSLGANKAIVIDAIVPTVSMSSVASNPTNTSPIAVTVTFSESVSGFTSGDITAGNGTISNFAGTGASYTFDLIPSANGLVTANIAASVAQDAAGNNNTAATQFSRTYDTTAPTVTNVTSTTANGTYTTPSVIAVTVTFSENVTVTGTPQLTLETGTIDRTANYASGSGTAILTFNYAVQAGDTSSDLDYVATTSLTLNGGTIKDAATNNATLTLPAPAATGSLGANKAIVIDANALTVTISSTTTGPTNTAPIPVTITFSKSVTGFVIGDITIGNGTTSNFAGAGAIYTVDITPIANGTITIDVAGGVAQDSASNGNIAATQFSITFDNINPGVSFIARVSTSPTNAASVNFTVTFGESVTGVDASDFILTTTGVTGASITGVSGSGATRTVTVNTGSNNGTIRLDVVDNNSITDTANNPLGGAGVGDGNYTSGETYTITRSSTFSDVPETHPYFNDIEVLYANGYTGGCSTTPLNFCPDVSMSRAQAAVFMMRGNYGSGYTPPTIQHIFADNWVNSSWGEGWAEGMYKVGLTAGCSPSPLKFCPDEILTNVQVAVFGLRLKYGNAYAPPAGTGTVFADLTDTGFWGTGWAEQAYVDGLLPACGTSGGKPKFCPDALVTRGFGASVIVKAKNLTMP